MYGLLMDDIVKMRRNSWGNFICHQIKIVTERKQRGSIDYLNQRNGPDRICVLGNEEDSFLN